MSKRKHQKRSRSQVILSLLSLLLVGSMVISFVIVALQPPTPAAPTPWPTITPQTRPTSTPAPAATSSPVPPTAAAPELTPTSGATEPVVGPLLPTETPTVTPTLTITASSGIDLRFAVCGDSRDNPRIFQRVLDAVLADGSEFLVHTGDLVNRGTESQWEGFQEMMAGFTLPFYPVPGNHDGLNGRLDGYLAYSGAPATHYSFDREPIHFVMTDSHNGGMAAGELAWLETDLKATTQPVKMVFLHHPPFDPDGTDHIMAFGNESFMTLMAAADVDHVFAGHIHAYAQEKRDGVTYTITGGAGAPLYDSGHPLALHHYLRVAVQGEDVTVEVVEV